MKKYVSTFILLLLIGVVLGYFAYEKTQAINNKAHQLTIESIKKIKQHDNELNVLLMKSRYGIDNHYDKIVEQVKSLSNYNRRLKSVLQSSEAKNSPAVLQSYEAYERQNSIKMDLVENFKTNNSALLNPANYSPFVGNHLIKYYQAENRYKILNFITEFNNQLSGYIKKGDEDSKKFLEANSYVLYDLEESSPNDIKAWLNEYSLHTQTVLKYLEPTQQYLVKTTEVPTGGALQELEEKYKGQRTKVFAQFDQVRYAALGYGILMLLAFLALLFKLRQIFNRPDGSDQIMSLSDKISKITQQLSSPLGFLANNMHSLESSFSEIGGTIEGLQEMYSEAKKPQSDRDNKKLNELLISTLRKYSKLDSHHVLDQTNDLIQGSSTGLNEISHLVSTLKEVSESEKLLQDKENEA